jgi:DUF4097 and DUF4098 domain-containing protein YvlB
MFKLFDARGYLTDATRPEMRPFDSQRLRTAIFLSVTLAGPLMGQRSAQGGIDTTFALEKRGTVSVSVTGGRLFVAGWENDAVRVHVRASPQDFRIVARPSEIIVEPDGGGTSSGKDAFLEVEVPAGARVIARAVHGAVQVRGFHGTLDVTTDSADITVNDLAGELHLGSVSGTINVARVTGAVDVSSVQGDVILDRPRGNVTIATVSGDVKLRNAAASFVRAQSTDGNLRYAGTIEAGGAYSLSTHSGDVQLSVPASVGATFTVATWSGSVESDFVMAAPSSGRRITFRVGSGSAQISLETFSGEIVIGVLGRRGRE